MHSIPTRFAILGIAAVIAASALLPASAATRSKRTAAPAQSEFTEQNVQLSMRGPSFATPAPALLAPTGCVSDEGYGRYTSCDGGTGM